MFNHIDWEPALAAIDQDDDEKLPGLLGKSPGFMSHYTHENELIDYASRGNKFLCLRIPANMISEKNRLGSKITRPLKLLYELGIKKCCQGPDCQIGVNI